VGRECERIMLTYTEEGHQYFWNGKRTSGVNEILIDVGINDFSGIPEDRRESAFHFGNVVHKTCEYYDKCTLDLDSIDDLTQSYLRGWIKFRNEFDIKFTSIEGKEYSQKYNFAGRHDRIFDTTICDIKTNISPAKNDDLKLMMYKILWEENHIERIDRMMTVHLIPDNYKIVPVEKKRFSEIKNDCICIVQFHKLKTKRGLLCKKLA
jgi:hypothetical protein